ncbi:MAG TPA: 30S ribosomal protein S9 [Ignavibacteria bacterium]|nr:30S ribosomal protein S9 [Bacteroidota bacterium]HRI83965.1 30S ribosomal protein S9 [Ignavibacteria bacterium]HRJ98734.1 30S ribosomal protein S9 [Ignavibacteria bacterium]
MSSNSTLKVGRRKTATARVLLKPGNGLIRINNKEAKDYFKTENLYTEIIQPFQVTNTSGTFDAQVNVNGGGFTGQAGAIKLGIARALVETNEELKSPLRKAGLMTRDPRAVERKKCGQPKARKKFQFSKR